MLFRSRKYSVNRAGEVEAIWQPLYHYQDVAATALPSQLTFFQNPVGSNGLTLDDTNVESAGQMPAPKEMLVTSIQVALLPDAAPDGGAVNAEQWNDVYTLSRNGSLSFFIGSKTYLNEAPLGRFPTQNRLGGVADNGGQTLSTGYSVMTGRVYEITPVRLISNQNFNVTINFNNLATNPALPLLGGFRIGVILGGFLYRLSQ